MSSYQQLSQTVLPSAVLANIASLPSVVWAQVCWTLYPQPAWLSFIEHEKHKDLGESQASNRTLGQQSHNQEGPGHHIIKLYITCFGTSVLHISALHCNDFLRPRASFDKYLLFWPFPIDHLNFLKETYPDWLLYHLTETNKRITAVITASEEEIYHDYQKDALGS